MVNQDILDELLAATRRHDEWAKLRQHLEDLTINVHLAIMLEPFLTYILKGSKTIESRFAKNAIAPYESVSVGDLVLLKAGPVVGSFRASSTYFTTLDEKSGLAKLRLEYGRAICATDDAFWNARADKRYATLIGIEEVRRLPPVPVPKRDMRGWVVVRAAERHPSDDLLSLW